MQRPKILYSGPYWGDEEISAAISNLKEGKWYSAGPAVDQFEREFSKQFNHKASLMVNSGSSANLVMLAAMKDVYKWEDYSEIIVSVVGFPTTINPIIQNRLKPRFVDIEWGDLNWSVGELVKAVTPRTVALLYSPVLGQPGDLELVKSICDEYNIHLLLDGCDSLGSRFKKRLLSDYATASTCSFYPAHHITTLEGGMVSSNDEDFIRQARKYAWWGKSCYCKGEQNLLPLGACGKRFSTWLNTTDTLVDHRYVFEVQGYNLKPLDLQGAIGSQQLKRFDEIHDLRRANYMEIKRILDPLYGVRVVQEHSEAETSWFGVPIICDTKKLKQHLQSHFENHGVQTRNYFAGNLLMHPAYEHLGDYKDYPVACQVLDKVFFLGCSPNLSSSDLDYINSVTTEFDLRHKIAVDGYSVSYILPEPEVAA
jgi:CDP-4-dehydro-6-deoxyglucose reductase, E1